MVDHATSYEFIDFDRSPKRDYTPRRFYIAYEAGQISETASRKSKKQIRQTRLPNSSRE